jgi:hypothetical protein
MRINCSFLEQTAFNHFFSKQGLLLLNDHPFHLGIIFRPQFIKIQAFAEITGVEPDCMSTCLP